MALPDGARWRAWSRWAAPTIVAVFEGFSRRPGLDELDALGAALGTSGGVSILIVPGVMPPYGSLEQCFPNGLSNDAIVADRAGIRATYEHFTDPGAAFDLVHDPERHPGGVSTSEDVLTTIADGERLRVDAAAGTVEAAR